jgi:hypothetical protein
MVGRFTFVSEATPTEISVVICFSSLAGLPDSLVRKDQREVCPLSRGVMSPKILLANSEEGEMAPDISDKLTVFEN